MLEAYVVVVGLRESETIVYVKTEWTNTLISSKVTIDVIYNCSFVKISYNTTMP